MIQESIFKTKALKGVDALFEAQKIAFGPIIFQAAKAMIDLGIFEALSLDESERISVKEIAKITSLPEYGVLVLIESGLSMGAVDTKDEKYWLTKVGFFLNSNEMTNANMEFNHHVNYNAFFHLKDAIKEGKPAGLKEFGPWETIYPGLTSLPDAVKKSWFNFDHFYSDTAFSTVLPILFKDKPKKILDVGGNTGKWAIACAKHCPDVHMTIFDLEEQVVAATENITEQDFIDRIDYATGNLLDREVSLPKGYNIIWMSQFLDCFSEDEIESLIKRAYDALSPDGYLCILETFWDRQKFEASAYCLVNTSLYFTCVANGTSRMYRATTFLDILDKLNFDVIEDVDNIGICHTLLKCKKKPYPPTS